MRSSPPPRSHRPAQAPLLAAAACLWFVCLPAAAQPYNPYADQQELHAPVAADGTLHWGNFYKSAAIQKTYERLWSLGACRGTNKAITIPVARNKLVIDNLPEESFTGRVRGAAGSLAGGLVAFSEGSGMDPASPVLVAQLHPAGVTHLQVGGRTSLSALKPGTTVRLRTTVDDKGRATDAVGLIEIVTPARDFVPDDVRPQVRETVVGSVLHARKNLLQVKVDAGRIRRLTLPLADDPVVMVIDAAQLDLVGPGDEVEIVGRRWSGEGSMGAGTVFASRIVVHKTAEPPQPPPETAAAPKPS